MNPGVNKMLPWLAAVLGGVLLFLGYAGFDQFYLDWIFLVPILWAIRDARPGRAFLIGWVAGIVGHAGGFYWVVIMFREFAAAPWPVAALGLLAIAAANGVVIAAWACATRFILRQTAWSVLWVAPVVWTAVEKLWPEIFPNYLGASQYLVPHLTQIADITGILGVSFLVVFINATIYETLACCFEKRRLPWRTLAVFAGVMVAVVCYGEFRIREWSRAAQVAPKLTVGLVQANRGAADIHLDPQTILREHQEISRTLAATKHPDLIVWPEGVCTFGLPSRNVTIPPSVLGNENTPMLMGACLVQPNGGSMGPASNSAVLTDASGRILGTYDKTVLVPFGEYIPFGDIFPILYSWSPYSSKFWRGQSVAPLPLGEHLLSVSICYEDIFPGHIRKLMHGGGEGRVPEAMFNLTNDSWYGKSTEPIEHLALASFRCIENRRMLVRVTNTGVSAFVDPVGRIVSRTGIWTKEVLVDRVPLLKGNTVYSAAGDWIGWLCALLTVAAVALGVARGRRGRAAGSR